MSEEGSGRRFRFDFGKLSFAEVYNNLRLGDIKRWISGRKYSIGGVVGIAAVILIGYQFLPSRADLFQAEQEKRVLGERLSQARVDSARKAKAALDIVQGYQRDTSAYGERVRGLEGEMKNVAETAVFKNRVNLLRGEINGLLAAHPYLQRMSFTKGFYDLDNNGSNESVEYASSPGGRILSGRSADDLAKVLEQIKTSQATYNELEASLTNLPSQDKKQIMGQFSRYRVKVFFDGTGNQIGVENLESGNKKTYSVATMSVGGQR